jgi:hypothetical protein
MESRTETIFSEIKQLRADHEKLDRREGLGWPSSIKDRVEELEGLGLSAKAIAVASGMAYATIMQWRYNRRSKAKVFHEVRVKAQPNVNKRKSAKRPLSKSFVQAMPGLENPLSESGASGLSLRIPSGFIIGGLDEDGVISLVTRFTEGGGHVA